jgi:hypothetical protein
MRIQDQRCCVAGVIQLAQALYFEFEYLVFNLGETQLEEEELFEVLAGKWK